MAFDSNGTVNKTILIGRLGQDPELKYTPSGAAVLTLSVATNTKFKGQSGETQEQTEWHRVVVWRKLAEIIGQYARKGTRVYVEGRLTTRNWEDQNGIKRYTTEVQADSVQLLGSKNEQGGGYGQQQSSSGAGYEDDFDAEPAAPSAGYGPQQSFADYDEDNLPF